MERLRGVPTTEFFLFTSNNAHFYCTYHVVCQRGASPVEPHSLGSFSGVGSIYSGNEQSSRTVVDGAGVVDIRDYALFLTLAIAVFTDLRSQKIYNVLTFPMTVLGIVASLQFGTHGWDGLAGAAVALGMGLLVEAMRAMRMGDVKLLMAVGALTTPAFAVRAVLLSVAVNLVYGVAILAAKGRLRRLWKFYKGEQEEATIVAYAPAIAAAVLWVRFMPWP